MPRHETATTAAAPNARIIWIITTSLLSQAIACSSCQSRFAVRRSCTQTECGLVQSETRPLFSIIVKSEPFTKHIECQSGASNLFPGEVIAAVQPLSSRRCVRADRWARAHLFSNFGLQGPQPACRFARG